jgi:hypothetical protein
MKSKATAPFRPAARSERHLRHGLVRAAFAIAAALAAAGTHAKTYCAHSASELQAALSDASSTGTSNNQDNTIFVTSGTFTTAGAPFFFGTVSGFALTLEGGYNGTCSSQDLAPGVSVLDGASLTQVLSIQTNGDITVRHLTIQNANYGGSAGGGAAIALNNANAGEIAIFDSNVVRDNFDGYGGGGGLSIFGNGTAYIENNLFSGNSGKTVAAFSASMTAGIVYITNNTITDNTNTMGNSAIVSIGAGTAAHVSNTISYGNHGTATDDFYLYTSNVEFVRDDYTSINGTPAAGSNGNLIAVDPKFVAVDDFHLRSTSPLLRAGTPNPAGGLPALDIEGHARGVAGPIDIGAFQNVDFIFANGFDPN